MAELEYSGGDFSGEATGADAGAVEATGGGTPGENVGGNPESYDPAEVANWKKSYETFTQKTQELADMRRQMDEEFTPYKQLAERLQSDDGLRYAIAEYINSGGNDPRYELESTREEVNDLRTQMRIDNEFRQLHKLVEEQGLPAFKEDDVLDYAADKRIINMVEAYKAMTFDAAREAERTKLEDDIKRSRGAQTVQSGRGDTVGSGGFSTEDIANMPLDKFLEQYNNLA